MIILCLLWLVTTVTGQHLASPDGACEEGWECRQVRHCDPYLDQRDRLERLEKLKGDGDNGVEYQKLSDKLKQLVCNKEEEGVCCKKQLEVVNGKIVEKVGDMPFIVRLKLKTGFSDYSQCGASLIASQFLLSARHCFDKFWHECTKETDCLAYFRDLNRGKRNHDLGEFSIPIVEVYPRTYGDLAVVELKHPVEEHPDYNLSIPIRPIRLASENPKPGEEVVTGGWGLTGYNQGVSEELRSLTLTITTV